MKSKLCIIQGIYYILAGIWPVLDIQSFMMVTGPKTDVWLVKMVGLLSFSIGLSLLYLKRYQIPPVLNMLPAISFLAVDVYYALTNTISDIYLGDAFLELLFVLASIVIFTRDSGKR
jgi:hypothetical protein